MPQVNPSRAPFVGLPVSSSDLCYDGCGMKTQGTIITLFLLLGCFVLTAWARNESAATPMEELVSMIPAVSSPEVYFTDWALLREYEGYEGISSSSPEEEKLEFMLSTNQGQAIASGFALGKFAGHAEMWGWDSTDLDWEAHVVATEISPFYILKFRESFDFSPTLELFAERGYVQTESHGALFFSHDLDITADWLRATELSILNVALLLQDRTMILSSYAGAPISVVATLNGELPPSPYTQVALSLTHQLGNAAAAVLTLGPGSCLSFSPNPLLDILGETDIDEAYSKLKESLDARQDLHPFHGMAVGYRYKNDVPIGFFIFRFPDEASAAEDLVTRKHLAEYGVSKTFEEPYAESAFVVNEAYTEGANLVLAVSPVGSQPRRLFHLCYRRDMLFAACP